MYAAVDIASWFKSRAKQDGEDIDIYKLMFLCYYAQGCSLALDNGRLFNEKIVAWGPGPAIIEVYDSFNKADQDHPIPNITSEDDSELLEVVYEIFGKPYEAWELREKTHRETPWIEASRNGTYFKNPEMTIEKIKVFFKEKYLKHDKEDNKEDLDQAPFTAIQVADHFYKRYLKGSLLGDKPVEMTIEKMMFMLQMAQNIHIAKYGTKLFNEDMIAVETGAWIPEVYEKYKDKFPSIQSTEKGAV